MVHILTSNVCFAGIVRFEPGYFTAEGWSNGTMDLVLDQAIQDKWASSAFEQFKERFDPVVLFDRSGVWEALD